MLFLPGFFPVFRGAPKLVTCIPNLVDGAPSCVVSILSLLISTLSIVVRALSHVIGPPSIVARRPWCSLGCYPISYVHVECGPRLQGAQGGHCISAVDYGISLPWDSGLTTPKHSHRLPVTKMHFADKGRNITNDNLVLLIVGNECQLHRQYASVQAMWYICTASV